MSVADRGRTGLAFAASSATDQGRVRSGNEDRVLVDLERGVFVVADGVGGHAAGEVAATIAIDVIQRRLERPLWSAEQRVREAIVLANNEVLTQSQASPELAGMTCVLTLALLTPDRLTVGHVGDTRLYTVTGERMTKLTHDHSPVGEREDAGELSELEAMRHPRRNQVFRDVGSAFHEPEDADFVEVIDVPFDEDSALLICSDGLSDMLTSAEIEQIVREHAGAPDGVTRALVKAANDAGGKDNVTVIYVEGAGFAQSTRSHRGPLVVPPTSATHPTVPAPVTWRHRALWLVCGLLLGLASAFALDVYLLRDTPAAITGSLLAVRSPGASGPEGSYATIAEAAAAAKPRDTLLLEPGEYAEAVVLPDGVSLTARQPGTALLVARPGQAGWTSLVASGHLGQRISGIRIVGRPAAPVAVALALTGHDIEVADVTIEGTVAVGFDVQNDGDVEIFGSRVLTIDGVPVKIGGRARPVIRQTQFVHDPDVATPAIEIPADALPELTGNLFAGYPAGVRGSADEPALRARNFFTSRPAPASRPGPARARGRSAP